MERKLVEIRTTEKATPRLEARGGSGIEEREILRELCTASEPR
jgi:hypothetical protein